MRKVAIPLAILALIGLDQWVKHWVVANIALNQVIKAIPGLFSLTYLQNRGAAFSILQDQKYFFVILTVLVIGAALVYLVKNYQKSLWLVLSLVLIISGGIGNFIDRLHLGYVVDMVQLDFIDFAIFNVADSYLTVGVLLFKEAGNRLDKALADLTELSRSQANEAIKAGTVLVNGKSAKAKYAVKEGDVITYELPEEEVLEYKAEDIPLDIIYEDADVAVVNKPQGMVVHPSAGHTSGTLVNALMYHVKDLSSINGVVRPGIVHRIDKDTSGLLMIAKNDKAHKA